jgi:hypothetical protein
MARTVVSGGSIGVEGLSKVQKDLKALGADKQEIINANYDAAQTLINAARPLVPKRSGRLVSTLKAGKAQAKATASAGSGKRVPYANPIHWGWSIVGANTKSNLQPGTIRNIKPQPFFAEALGYTRFEIVANYKRDMQNLVNKYGLGDN